MNPDLIRSALQLQAERAPDAQLVQAGLQRRMVARAVRRRRSGAVALAAAAVVAVLAVVTPALLTGRGGGRAGDTTIGAGTAASPSIRATAPTPYRPTWLPPGFLLSYVDENTGSDVARSYRRTQDQAASRESDPPQVTLIVSNGSRASDSRAVIDFPDHTGVKRSCDPCEAQGVPPGTGTGVSINGVRGWYVRQVPGFQATISWEPRPGTTVSVGADPRLRLTEAQLVRIARSVVPDRRTTAVPVTLGWLPDGLATDQVTVSAPGQPGRVSVSAGPVIVTVGRSAEPSVPRGGELLTVGGHPARWVSIPQGGKPLTYLVVTLGPRRTLTVEVDNGFHDGRPIDREASIRIAGAVVVDDTWRW